ncbi:MAG: DUF1638 domain-containing protein [Deltaproteobacteria bacterium]|nr:DUF1638 domain-containing protein [Deltaproteobacteria bacterium]
MSVLGVITCQTLELEIAHLLVNDPDVQSVTVLKNRYADGLLQALESERSVLVNTVSYVGAFRPAYPRRVEALVQIMEVGLHTVITNLRQAVTDAATDMGPYVDAILLGYGLCGNALEKVEELLSDTGVPVFMASDEDHPVDDCVALLIGGRELYYQEQCRCAGTMFMTPGFANHWKQIMLKGLTRGYSLEMCKRLMANYERVLLLPSEVMSADQMGPSVEEFNDIWGLRTEIGAGTLQILERTWRSAKESVQVKGDLV